MRLLTLVFLFPGDPLYPNFFKINDEIVPTGSSNVPIDGTWVKRSNLSEDCDPELQGLEDGEECFFKPVLDQVRIEKFASEHNDYYDIFYQLFRKVVF